MKKASLIIFAALCLSFTVRQTTTGTATFYHDRYHGRLTASGEIFSQLKMTCASNVYKIGTKLKITNLQNSKSVIVRVNDTGNLYGRTVDLSTAAFSKIAKLETGIIKVIIKVI